MRRNCADQAVSAAIGRVHAESWFAGMAVGHLRGALICDVFAQSVQAIEMFLPASIDARAGRQDVAGARRVVFFNFRHNYLVRCETSQKY